jgi:hypothetical protein
VDSPADGVAAHDTAPRPRYVRDGEAVYLGAPAPVRGAARWRVYWVCFGPPLAKRHRKRALPPGDARANDFWFVSPDGGGVYRVFSILALPAVSPVIACTSPGTESIHAFGQRDWCRSCSAQVATSAARAPASLGHMYG